MEGALRDAGLAPGAIDYINLHGTGTPANDATEDRAVVDLFGRQTRCSSTKGWTGHTLGACGAIEAIISALAIGNDFLPGSMNTRNVDAAMGLRYLLENETGPVDRVMSNAFGFGGTNCSLVMGRAGR
jgi:3-oxoacyl-[acyl-carrier-protein] synthase-1